MRLLTLTLLVASLSGCAWTSVKSGQYRFGMNLANARLVLIAQTPSDAGTAEAMGVWARHPDNERAQAAVFAALADHLDVVERDFGKLESSSQSAVLDRLGTTTGEQASGFALRVLPVVGPTVQEAAVRSLAGRQDATALDGLAELARSSDRPELRILAVGALHPAISETAITTLTGLVAATDETEELRLAALHALRPHDHPDARAPLAAFAGQTDDPVAAATFDALRLGRGDDELDAGLAATSGTVTGPAATRFLGASTPWASRVQERLHQLATDARSEVRWESAVALVVNDDDAGGPPMVAFLDDPDRQGTARDHLDRWELGATPHLRARAGDLTTPAGRSHLVELLADVGGPDDRALLTKLGADAPAIERLSTAPYGLFADGTAVWGDPATLSTRRAPLQAAVSELRDQAAAEGLAPGPRYVALARAWAFGGRSDASRSAATAAAQAARDGWILPIVLDAQTSGDFAGVVLREEAASALGRGVRAPLQLAPEQAHLPSLAVTGSLSCESNTGEDVSTFESSESIPYQMPNPAKQQCLDWLATVPQYDTQCRVHCNRTTGGDPYDFITSTCSGAGRSGYTCTYTTEQITSSAYERAAAQCDDIPDTYTEYAKRTVRSDNHTLTTRTTCSGELTATLATHSATAPVSFEGDRVETWTIRSAPGGELPNGEYVESIEERLNDAVQDSRRERFADRVASALSALSVGEAQVRSLYADAVGPALAARDGDAAIHALLVADPFRLDPTSEAFRATFVGDGEASFPTAWRAE